MWPVHCHDEFTVQQTVIFLVMYGKLHHGDILVLLNKIYGLQFGLVECIYGAQHHLLDQKKSNKHHLCLPWKRLGFLSW